jgi:anti-sigma B factor antagonist
MGERNQFRIEQETTDQGVAVLSLHGDVDIYSAPAFKEALLQVISDGWQHVLVDLAAAPFIDSTGLGVLVSGAKRARRGALAIICNDASTRLIFEVVGFDRLFTVYDSRADAFAALALEGFGHTAARPG